MEYAPAVRLPPEVDVAAPSQQASPAARNLTWVSHGVDPHATPACVPLCSAAPKVNCQGGARTEGQERAARQMWHGGAGERGNGGSAGFEPQRHLHRCFCCVVDDGRVKSEVRERVRPYDACGHAERCRRRQHQQQTPQHRTTTAPPQRPLQPASTPRQTRRPRNT